MTLPMQGGPIPWSHLTNIPSDTKQNKNVEGLREPNLCYYYEKFTMSSLSLLKTGIHVNPAVTGGPGRHISCSLAAVPADFQNSV